MRNPPHWLRQLPTLAHVHAFFPHQEEFLRNGDLLPGPEPHGVSKELPACELPTGDPTARVLTRKHRTRSAWLLTAWAADGEARPVIVSLPENGALTLDATPEGAVYFVSLRESRPTTQKYIVP